MHVPGKTIGQHERWDIFRTNPTKNFEEFGAILDKIVSL